MTDLDKKLIEKAQNTRRWDYQSIDTLIAQAETAEAKHRLSHLKWDLYDSVMESI